MTNTSLFHTPIYRARLSEGIAAADLETAAYATYEDDEAGQQWCEDNGYPGYTSYASLTDLPWRNPVIAEVV